MKHELKFNNFLNDHVNLNPSRLELLDNRVTSVIDHIQSNLPNYKNFSRQGSYAQGTIIKPVRENDEFDADILIYINDEGFNPYTFEEDYVSTIYSVMRKSGNYEKIVKRKSRCVTVDYSGDFHLDIVPCIEYGSEKYICNRTECEYEKTDGDSYKNWLTEKNRVVGSNNLKKVTRLFKFLRDHKSNFSIASILLTTIVGNQIEDSDEASGQFKDLPQSLKTLSNRVNEFLQANPDMPIIPNPVLLDENFNRKWDETKYKNFRSRFDIYNGKINDAFDEKDYNKSIEKWRSIFGNKFGKTSDSSTASVALASSVVTTLASIPRVDATQPYSSNG